MDKYEYKLRSEEIEKLMKKERYVEAAKIADTIDWRRVKSTAMLHKIGRLYQINRRFEESKALFLMAFDRNPNSRTVLYSLCEVCLDTGDIVNAIEYYKDFARMAPRDIGIYTLRYKMYELQDTSLEEKIELLEELKKREYIEEWAYELAYLYHRVGLATKCVEECDEIILWFGDGSYVYKAMELKMKHQPLTPTQQAKYDRRNEKPIKKSKKAKSKRFTEEMSDVSRDGDFDTGEMRHGSQHDAMDIQVKTMDVGQYNTLNLQKALAENMAELLDGDDLDEDPVKRAIAAPLFKDTSNLESAMAEIGAREIRQSQPAKGSHHGEEMSPEDLMKTGNVDAKEVFFEEKDTEEMSPQELEGHLFSNYADSKKKSSMDAVIKAAVAKVTAEDREKEAIDLTLLEKGKAVPVQAIQKPSTITEIQEITPPKAEEIDDITPASPKAEPAVEVKQGVSTGNLTEGIVPEERKSLLASEESMVEKQITGQMNISDVMKEWESVKKNAEKKRQDELRKKVLEQTGPLFSSFDESRKAGALVEMAEDLSGEVALKAGKTASGTVAMAAAAATSAAMTGAAATEAQLKPADSLGNDLAQGNETREKKAPIKERAHREERIPIEERVHREEKAPIEEHLHREEKALTEDRPHREEKVPVEEQSQPIVVPVEADPVAVAFEAEARESEEEVSKEAAVVKEDKYDTAKLQGVSEKLEEAVAAQEQLEEEEEDRQTVMREFTKEEKELFGYFLYSRKVKRQIMQAMEQVSLASYTGNVIITGETGSGTMTLAKNIVKDVQMMDGNFSGKVARIKGNVLDKKNIPATLAKLSNGALIIEKANGLSKQSLQSLAKVLEQGTKGIIVIMADSTKEMKRLLSKNKSIGEYFNARINVDQLDNEALVAFAKKYARDFEYSIDEVAVLALHTRISDMQTGEHAVTIAEVKAIMDEAISHSKRPRISTFTDIIFGKRYDDNDMIILREKDFF